MKVVITGASGFVGSHLGAALLRQGFEVVAVARREGPGLHCVASYDATPEGDLLFHLAGESDRSKANAQGDAFVTGMTGLTRRLCERFAGRLVYASSAAVYSGGINRKLRTTDPVEASDTYARAKLECEAIVLKGGGAVFRLSNIYGRGMAHSTVVSELLRQLPTPGPLRVRNTLPVCDFLHVFDAVAALCAVAEKRVFKCLNLGSGTGTSILELARLLAQLEGGMVNREILCTEPLPGASFRVLDIDETKEALGWQPRITLAEGMGNLLQAS